ncbi:SMODS domain-containing nucleotidyltransferase [Bradyrhizobium sp. SZCCHNS3053]|uniref:SMODS domain-containing nucleotidyltransferase n=1 Tax=Bradyrhizobium sp. SZCCHNS3053 TaxID=3057322 RepID=UPI002916E6AD|nr:nucleotidyltransferase [Bradyrhizobium sp. SZCCHNS3053]
MKHASIFKTFLADTINLNDTRVKDLETSIEAIKNAVRSSDWTPHINGWMPHGSWAHKTIIKPVDQREFDADLIVFVEHVQEWTAAGYINELYSALRSNSTYKDMVSRSSHCVTISYSNDKKIDIAPCLTNRTFPSQLEVCNRTNNTFERTEPKLYTDWLVEKNSFSGSNSFRKVTRLIKYLRDIKESFTCSSVLLTTMLGYHITSTDQGSAAFADTPTALRTIFGRVDDWLQLNQTKPTVNNPFLYSENFAEVWTDDKYSNFRDKFHTYREWIDDAYAEQDPNESISKWRRVFGSDFGKGEVLEEARSVTKSAVDFLKNGSALASTFTGDLVEAVQRFGFQILPDRFYRLPYMDKPKWKQANHQISVQVRANLHQTENGPVIAPVTGTNPLTSGYWVHFRAFSGAGIPFNANDYKVYWRVTNTDEAALRANALRGGFYDPETENGRWEALAYRGVHVVEAFVVRTRDNRLVGKSEPFQVVVG